MVVGFGETRIIDARVPALLSFAFVSRGLCCRLPNQNCRPSVQRFTWKLRVHESTIRRFAFRTSSRVGTINVSPSQPFGETVLSAPLSVSTLVHIAARERYHALSMQRSLQKEIRMLNRYLSIARPVSGSHPPNSPDTIIRKLVRKLAAVAALSLGAASAAAAQVGTTISGTVTSEAGAPLPGATVLIQGTTIGTHTDDAGRYTIVVPASRANGQSAVLVARTIGYAARTVPIVLTAGSNVTQNFALVVNPLNLDVVVVTGAGTSTTRERLTTTINTVDSSALNRAANPQNVVSALAAQAPNVEVRTQSGEPGASASIRFAVRRHSPAPTSRSSSSTASRSTIRRSRPRASPTAPARRPERMRARLHLTARRISIPPTSSRSRF